jgi:hypothetical protein
MSGCASLSQRSSTGSRPFTPLTLYVAIFIGLAVTLGFRRSHPWRRRAVGSGRLSVQVLGKEDTLGGVRHQARASRRLLA